MSEAERRIGYDNRRVLIETERVLAPQFGSAVLCLSGAQVELLRNVVAYLNRASTFVTEYSSAYYLTPTASEWDSLQSIVADLEDMLMIVLVQEDYVCVRDKRVQGVAGGTFSLGDWRTRTINDEQSDSSEICSVSGNQITLASGVYRCSVSIPAYKVDSHLSRLWNMTDDELVLGGTSEYTSSDDGVCTCSLIAGGFELVEEKVLEVQHRCTTTRLTLGFGVASGLGEEVYTVAEFWRRIG